MNLNSMQEPKTWYRIYDQTDKNTLANQIPTLLAAEKLKLLLELDLPNNLLEIEAYTV
jgi:hypothetical protein